MSDELKACPGCKGTDIRSDRDGQEFPLSVVWCHDCGLSVDDHADCKRIDETPFDRWQGFVRPSLAPIVSGEMVPECDASPLPSGKHQVDTSMESGPNNCFFCERPMPVMLSAASSPDAAASMEMSRESKG